MWQMNRMRRAGWSSFTALVGLLLPGIAASSVVLASSHDPVVGSSRAGASVAPGLTIPPGTDIPVTIDEDIALKREDLGQTFPAHVTRDVRVDGSVVIPEGAAAEVRLVESEQTPGAATFRLARVSIGYQIRRVETDVARADATRSGLSTGKKTGIGAIAGGVLGLVTGGGLLKGAVIGAGGGLAWGLLDRGTRRVEQDTPLLFSLRDAVRVE